MVSVGCLQVAISTVYKVDNYIFLTPVKWRNFIFYCGFLANNKSFYIAKWTRLKVIGLTEKKSLIMCWQEKTIHSID